MVFAAVPKDVTIEKLTGPQKKALDEYLGKDTRKSILERIAGNEKVPSLIAGAALLASLPKLLSIILPLLAKQIPGIPSDAAELIDQAIFLKDLNEALGEIIIPGGRILFEGEAKDFWDKYVTK